MWLYHICCWHSEAADFYYPCLALTGENCSVVERYFPISRLKDLDWSLLQAWVREWVFFEGRSGFSKFLDLARNNPGYVYLGNSDVLFLYYIWQNVAYGHRNIKLGPTDQYLLNSLISQLIKLKPREMNWLSQDQISCSWFIGSQSLNQLYSLFLTILLLFTQ